jgi:hypothetical protein
VANISSVFMSRDVLRTDVQNIKDIREEKGYIMTTKPIYETDTECPLCFKNFKVTKTRIGIPMVGWGRIFACDTKVSTHICIWCGFVRIVGMRLRIHALLH